MSKYNDFLTKQLGKGRHALGGELADALVATFNVKPDNARKIVQRASERGVILSSKPLSFGNGQYLYLSIGSYFGMQLVKEVSKKHRKSLYRLLELLNVQKIVSFYEGLKITSSPEEKTSSKVSLLKEMIVHLEKLKLVETRKDDRGNYYIMHRVGGEASEDIYKNEMEGHYRAMQLDAMFIPDLLRWMKSVNLIDLGVHYRNINTPVAGVKHNNLFWDALAYTRTTGINKGRASEADSESKQTLVTIDITISRKYLQVDLDGYLARLQINLNSAKMAERKILPVVIYHDIDEITYNRAKKLGFLTIDIKNIYGKNISKVMDRVRVLYHESLQVELSEVIEDALSAIEKSGHTNQLRILRGVLFEALIHPVLKYFYPNSQIIQGKTLKNPKNGRIREFDIIIISSHPKEVLLVELKGYTGKSFIRVGSAETKDTLRYFFRGSVPVAQDFYREDKSLANYAIKSAYITTGGYHSDTIEFITKMSSSDMVPTKIDIFYDGQKLIFLLEANGFEYEAKVIKKYYLH